MICKIIFPSISFSQNISNYIDRNLSRLLFESEKINTYYKSGFFINTLNKCFSLFESKGYFVDSVITNRDIYSNQIPQTVFDGYNSDIHFSSEIFAEKNNFRNNFDNKFMLVGHLFMARWIVSNEIGHNVIYIGIKGRRSIDNLNISFLDYDYSDLKVLCCEMKREDLK